MKEYLKTLSILSLLYSTPIGVGKTTNKIEKSISEIKDTTKEILDFDSSSLNLSSENKKDIIDYVKNNFGDIIENYTVKNGDTIASIAGEYDINNYEELVNINTIYGTKLLTRGKKIIIKSGDIIKVPKKDKIIEFNNNIDKLNQILDTIKTNALVSNFDLQILNKTFHDVAQNIFPQNVESIGIQRLMQSFLNTQKYIFDPELPRITDISNQRAVTCAAIVRRVLYYSVNPFEMKKEERDFFNKSNIDAWILPEELIKINFVQKHSLMEYFDKSKVGSFDPIGDNAGYEEGLVNLVEYLEKDGIEGSLIPFYFRGSNYKGVVRRYNAGKDKAKVHYNTHQSIYAGNSSMIFKAYEVKDIRNGIKNSFGIDKKEAQDSIKNGEKRKIKLLLEINTSKQNILNYIKNIKNNNEIWTIDKFITKFATKDHTIDKNQEYRDLIYKAITLNNPVSSYNYYKTNKSKVAKSFYSLDMDSIIFLINLNKAKNRVLNHVQLVENSVKTGNLLTEYNDSRFSKFPGFGELIGDYNSYMIELNGLNNLISTKYKLLSESETGVKKMNITDYIVNFIQQRSDYSTNAISDERKKIVKQYLLKFANIIKIKVNGTEINLDVELKKEIENQVLIKPNDIIELSGAMMIDGLHMMNSESIDRAHNMNARTRFLWEFITSGMFLATEIIEPTPKSSFWLNDFKNSFNDLDIKYTYDVRSGDTVESVLKKYIPIFEKEAFDKLDENADDYEKKRKNLLQYYYSTQIKALQLTGYLQTENSLNRNSIMINRPIPYFNDSNVSKVFDAHIKNVKKESVSFSDIDRYADFIIEKTLPGDTLESFFHRLKTKILYHTQYKDYKNLSKINGLNHYLQKTFIEKFMASSIKSKDINLNDFINKGKIPLYIDMLLDIKKIDEILENISNISYCKASKIKDIDTKVIELVSSNEQSRNILKIVVKKESYPTKDGSGIRIRLKKSMEMANPILSPIGKGITSLGDFQVRLYTLKNGYSKEWPTKQDIEDAINILYTDDFINLKNSLNSEQKEAIDDDLSYIKNIQEILKIENPDKSDFIDLYKNLFKLMRLDINPINLKDGGSTNIVGKIIGAYLMNKKINTHFIKLNGQLYFAGENVLDIYKDPAKMAIYEKAILMINNLSENIQLTAFFHNTITRILIESKILKIEEIDQDLDTNLKGQIEYNKEVFRDFLEHSADLAENKKGLNNNQKIIMTKLVLLANKKNITNSDLFNFIRDPQLVEVLDSLNISKSIIPKENEFSGTKFRNKIFRYVNNLE